MSRFHNRAARYFGLAVLLVVLCAVGQAFANDEPAQPSTWTVGLHVASAHSRMDPWTRNDTPGLYVRHASGATAGAYRNSLGRTTAYAGWTVSAGWVDLTAGVATGYQRRWTTWDADGRRFGQMVGSSNSPLMPFATASVALPVPGLPVTPRLTWMPKVGGLSQHVLHLSVERSF